MTQKHWSIALSEWLQSPFSQRGPLFFLFFPLLLFFSLLYQFLFFSFFLFKRKKTFSQSYQLLIGNSSLGGTGKTPLLQALACHLLKKGKSVSILMRAYQKGNHKFETIEIHSEKDNPPPWHKLSDEVRETLWVLQNTLKVKNPNWKIYQQNSWRSLKDTQEWLLIEDGAYSKLSARPLLLHRPHQPHYVPPLGFQRTGWGPLKAWHAFWFEKPPICVKVLQDKIEFENWELNYDLNLWSFHWNQTWTWEQSTASWKNLEVNVQVGIAQPEIFVQNLKKRGVKVKGVQAFADHGKWSTPPTSHPLLITLKDWCRWSDLPFFLNHLSETGSKIWVVQKTFLVPTHFSLEKILSK